MKIKLALSEKGIEQAIKEYENWQKTLETRIEQFVKRLSEMGAEVAKIRFTAAVYDGDMSDIAVQVEHDGKKATIYATGQAVGFIEFGTGVAFAEHPSGLYAHGTYGDGKGSNPNGWVYDGVPGPTAQPVYNRKGEQKPGVWRTKGNPPACAMWESATQMAASVKTVWEEVMR